MNKVTLFLVFLVIAVLGLILDSQGKFGTVKNFSLKVISPLSGEFDQAFLKMDSFFKTVGAIFSLVEENKKLKDELLSLKSKQINLEELTRENERLKQDLGFLKDSSLSFIPANVVARSPLGIFPSLTLDKGKKEGINEGAAAVKNGFLLGEIREVFNNHSVVWLITNPNQLVPAILSESRTPVLLKATLSGLSLENIPQDVEVKVNEVVLTSGLDQKLPKGIAIGKVTKIIELKSDIFKQALISSPIDFNRIETVLITK